MWPEPIAEGDILSLTEVQAAMLNGDSPGLVEPIELVEKPPVQVVEEPARVVEEPPLTMAKRLPRKRTVED
jgi:hypothetical protein